MPERIFHFKQFGVCHERSAMKVGTDAVLLGAWATHPAPRLILDVGCGCGVISLMLAQRYPEAEITGVEIDWETAAETTANFQGSPWACRLECVNIDFTEYEPAKRFDLIVSNPPYFDTGALNPQLKRLGARHQSSLTLTSLLSHARELLATENSEIALILPSPQDYSGSATVSLAEAAAFAHLNVRRICDVCPAPTKLPVRTLYQLTPTFSELEHCSMALKDVNNYPTLEYRRLVSDFYLRLS